MRLGFLPSGIALALVLAVGGCGPTKADLNRLQDRLARIQATLESEREAHEKTSKRLRGRIARLEAELAIVRRQMASSRRPGPRPPTRPAVEPPRPAVSPPRASCPGDLPDGARKVRRRMREAKARRALTGVRFHEAKSITISGSGTRTRRVWTGPCFRITLAGGRVARVELEGARPRRRSRRRRRKRRRRR